MRTKLKRWQTYVEEDMKMKYVELTHTTPTHIPNQNSVYSIPFPDTILGISIKTIKVISEQNILFTVDLMDGNSSETIYESTDEVKYHYDQIDIPYKPIERALFVRLHNKGNLATKFTIIVRGIEVK